MCDEDDGLELLQMALEPRDRFCIEVVGRLIQEQQIGFGEQRADKGRHDGAHPGEVGDWSVWFRHSQRVHGDVNVLIHSQMLAASI